MKQKKAFIIEDNIHQLDEIKTSVKSHPHLELIGFSLNGSDALKTLQKIYVDLLFLDINLPACSGIEILEKLENPPYTIFITAYDKYAIKAFELGAIDYILKPFSSERLESSINRFLKLEGNHIQKSIKKLSFSFKSNGTTILLSHDDIIYVTASNKSTIIHTPDKDFTASQLMKDLEIKLPSDKFIRIHRKYMVNITKISHISSNRDELSISLNDEDETHLPVSKSNRSKIKDMFT